MSRYQLLLPHDFEQFEWELASKGWYSASAICLNTQKKIVINFYDQTRLNQEIDDLKKNGTIFSEKYLVVVPVVDLDNIEAAIQVLNFSIE